MMLRKNYISVKNNKKGAYNAPNKQTAKIKRKIKRKIKTKIK